MTETTADLKCLIRAKTEIPVIKLGYDYVTRLIADLKDSSAVVKWSLNKATSSVDQMVKYCYIRDQLFAVDQMLCTSLDLTELNLPALTKTPHEMYEESVEYVMGIVKPITDWVDVELLPPMDCYVDCYLPELDPDLKTTHVNNGNGLRVSELAVKITRRIKQHVYAESIYSGNLLYSGYEEMILLIKIIIFDPKLMSKTFLQIWKKLGDGVTPNKTANSLLLMEMGYIRLRNVASTLVQMIELTEEIVKCYIEMFIRYVNSRKNFAVEKLSRVMIPEVIQHLVCTGKSPKEENSDIIVTFPNINTAKDDKSSTSSN